ncbi:MAG: polysaccharide deacetylase family protein [Candidatus Bathyarchaeota archaeon]|nr:polysaccharide deacetylase family protein [Candidatus Bathyarchaeota archaeon]
MTVSKFTNHGSNPPANILTVDVEDWYHGISRYVEVPSPKSRLQYSLPIILDLLREYRAKATFFVLGEVAQNFPELVERIVAEGHEVGCHGFSHRHIEEIGAVAFDEEVRKATRLLEKICGSPILSFRAPIFSITKSTFWGLKIIKKNGYIFDSSIFPTYHPFYGIPNEPCQPHAISFSDKKNNDLEDEIIEFPILTRRFLNTNIPVGGGAYLRFLGQLLLANSVINMNTKGWPATIYIHPWELDSFVPDVKFNPAIRFITFHNVGKTKRYLETLLRTFKFVSIRDFCGRDIT